MGGNYYGVGGYGVYLGGGYDGFGDGGGYGDVSMVDMVVMEVIIMEIWVFIYKYFLIMVFREVIEIIDISYIKNKVGEIVVFVCVGFLNFI